jgi:benzil reductase ((S)-benzoin forming)
MKKVIITGTSRGLGKAMFDILVERRACVLSISRRFLPYQLRLARTNSSMVKLAKFDLGVDLNGARLRRYLSGFLGHEPAEVVFINNAGTVEPIGPVGRLERRRMLRAAFVNFISPMMITNELLRLSPSSRVPVKILNISSGAARRPIAGWGLYCATKSAASMFFGCVKEQAGRGSRVSIVSIDPGVIDTDMQKKIRIVSAERFPMKKYFIDLKNNNELTEPVTAARRILEGHIL